MWRDVVNKTERKKVWVVEFEEPDEDILNSLEYGIIGVDDEGIVQWYYGNKEVLLPWRVIEKREVERRADE